MNLCFWLLGLGSGGWNRNRKGVERGRVSYVAEIVIANPCSSASLAFRNILPETYPWMYMSIGLVAGSADWS